MQGFPMQTSGHIVIRVKVMATWPSVPWNAAGDSQRAIAFLGVEETPGAFH
jgi:hypothetical protein